MHDDLIKELVPNYQQLSLQGKYQEIYNTISDLLKKDQIASEKNLKLSDLDKMTLYAELAKIQITKDLDYSQALTYLDETLLLAKKLTDTNYMAFCYHYYGTMHLLQDKLVDSEENLSLAITISQQYGYRAQIIDSLINLALVHAKMGHLQLALEKYLQLLTFQEVLNDPIDLLNVWTSTAEIYWQLGRLDEAYDLYGRVLDKTETSVDSPDKLIAQAGRTKIELFRGDFKQAEQSIKSYSTLLKQNKTVSDHLLDLFELELWLLIEQKSYAEAQNLLSNFKTDVPALKKSGVSPKKIALKLKAGEARLLTGMNDSNALNNWIFTERLSEHYKDIALWHECLIEIIIGSIYFDRPKLAIFYMKKAFDLSQLYNTPHQIVWNMFRTLKRVSLEKETSLQVLKSDPDFRDSREMNRESLQQYLQELEETFSKEELMELKNTLSSSQDSSL